MQIKCSYCGNFISDTDPVCPHCNAPNEGVKRTSGGVPHTIEELKTFVREKNIPVDKFRFFIGEDYRGPKAFGIYKDESSGNFVVYKNKSDGERSVRYEGKDEAYAVNEIYQKLKEQVSDYKNFRLQKEKSRGASSGHARTSADTGRSKGIPGVTNKVITVLVIAIAIALFLFSRISRCNSRESKSFYNYNGSSYMYDTGTSLWYLYNSLTDDYETVDAPTELEDSADDYFDHIEEYNTRTTDSSWDDDDDYDWGSDDWDSGWDSDWDSDWGSDWDSDW